MGVEKWWRIFAKQLNFKKIKNCQFIFFYILQLPHTVISNSEKLTHPTLRVPRMDDPWPNCLQSTHRRRVCVGGVPARHTECGGGGVIYVIVCRLGHAQKFTTNGYLPVACGQLMARCLCVWGGGGPACHPVQNKLHGLGNRPNV